MKKITPEEYAAIIAAGIKAELGDFTAGFAAACYSRNCVHELLQGFPDVQYIRNSVDPVPLGPVMTEEDYREAEAWSLSPDEWRKAIVAALACMAWEYEDELAEQ